MLAKLLLLPRFPAALFAVMTFFAGLTAAAAAPAPKIRRSPPPGWTTPLVRPKNPVPTAAAVSVYWVLVDRQTRHVGAAGSESFRHYASVVLNADGVSRASKITAYFEPSFQTLRFHYVRVVRGGKTRNALDLTAFRTSSDNDSSRRIYSGIVSATLEIPDVRVGDVVEYAYTIKGSNPVFGDAILGSISMRYGDPIGHILHRVLVPKGRTLSSGAIGTDREPRRLTVGAFQEYRFELRDVPALLSVSQTPSWFPQQPIWFYSSYADWNAVAVWADELYEPALVANDDVRALAKKIGREHRGDRERIQAAMRFVQDEVRYVGIEVDEHSHRPHSAGEALAQRFGDCKDKSTLLTALLRELDIEAEPALVSTNLGKALPDRPPTPYAFNHVIVRAQLRGKTVWIDPTLGAQRGPVFVPPPYDHALPVGRDVKALVRIPTALLNTPTQVVHETYSAGTKPNQRRLEVVSTFTGTEADNYRQTLRRETHAEISRGYENYYAGLFDSIERVAELDITDDETGNIIVVTETYLVDGFYKDGTHALVPSELTPLLTKPSILKRDTPFSIAHPVFRQHTISVHVDPSFQYTSHLHDEENDFFHFTVGSARRSNVVEITGTYRSAADHVPAAKLTEYLAAVDNVNANSSYELTDGETEYSGLEGTGNATTGVIVVLLISLAIWGLIYFHNRSTDRVKATMAASLASRSAASGPVLSAQVQPAAHMDNSTATTAMVLGVVGFWLCGMPLVGQILGILAIVYGNRGRKEAMRMGGAGFGSATAGMVLGCAGLLFGAITVYVVITSGALSH